ncbi:probable cation transporter HKT7 isoform X2 [Eucalyptus grandis]|uniref:probable cation transporter HKT7 isoform X2 n=1 Tax=Eucalyptus grandis TaxID=71139 RepID=UPI0008A09E46|nr:probable cation transporter HKT7 isoform X2 [Eucalyptus grandis]
MSSMKKLIHSCHYAGSQFCNWVRPRAARLLRLCRDSISWLSRFLLFHVHPFWIQLGYYLAVSLAGYLVLKATARDGSELRHRDLDLFFTSVSATTASSMSTVEMEELSRAQLLVMIVLMLLSGEVFTSLLELQLLRLKLLKQSRLDEQADRRSGFVDCIELGIPSSAQKVDSNQHNEAKAVSVRNPNMSNKLKYDAATCLSQVVLGYILVFHVLGSGLITLYVYLDRDAKQVLERKGLRGDLFSLFTMVSTFASCGFVPLNEGMVAFRKSPGLLLILIPQVLAGNTLYAPCLHAALWALEKASAKRKELGDALRNGRDVGYFHLLGSVRCRYICLTALLFVTVQLVLFCGLEWRSGIMSGLTPYQKLVCSLFQVVNSRYAGESAFDLSMVSPAVLVLFLVMMWKVLSRDKKENQLMVPPALHVVRAGEVPSEGRSGTPDRKRRPSSEQHSWRVLHALSNLLPGHLRRRRLYHRAAGHGRRPPQLQRAEHRRRSDKRVRERGIHDRLQLRAAAQGGGLLQRRDVWFCREVEQDREADHRCGYVLW